MTGLRIFCSGALLPVFGLFAQQLPDSLFDPGINDPRYTRGAGPLVAVDEAHGNFHTLSGRYRTFGKVLEHDGYRTAPFTTSFTPASLKELYVLVIANPLASSNQEQWTLPTPSAFTPAETFSVHDRVRKGGRLLLIADHMTFAGAAQELGRSFGFEWSNCFAFDDRRRTFDRFHRSAGLMDHAITTGVDTVVTFTGSAFQLAQGAEALIALGPAYTLLEPHESWVFEESTPWRKGEAWYQAACLQVGKGRVVVCGEAAMFSAQLAGPQAVPVGLNQPEARGNITLLRNILAWLCNDPAR